MVTGICRTARELQKWVLFAGGLAQLPLFQGASGRFQHPEIVDRGYKYRYYLIRGTKAGPRGDAACMNSVGSEWSQRHSMWPEVSVQGDQEPEGKAGVRKKLRKNTGENKEQQSPHWPRGSRRRCWGQGICHLAF